MENDILKSNGISTGFMVYKWNCPGEDFQPNKELYRLNNGSFIICIKGKITISINMVKYVVNESSLITIFPHSIVQYHEVSEDFEGYVIFFTTEFASNIEFKRSNISFITELHKNPLLSVEEKDLSLFIDYCHFLKKVENNELSSQYSEIRQSLLNSFLYTIGAAYRSRSPQEVVQEKPTRGKIIFHNFLNVLSEYYQSERSVTFYADKLCITPKYLSSVCKETCGKLAMDIIAHAVILDAKSKLHDFSLTVQEISDMLNFPNASFFGRYFKRHTGYSPMQYRETLN